MKYRDFPDATGMIFGRFTVLHKLPESTTTNPRYQCRCNCGVEMALYGHQLARGVPKGCIKCRKMAARAK